MAHPHQAQADLSIIIVNVNAADMLRRCLRSIIAAKADLRIEIILIDNASTDDSVQVAMTLWPEIICRQQQRNIGYVRANNLGLQDATGRYVLYLNNDTELAPDCLVKLLSFMQDQPRVGAASPQILNPDGSDQGCARCFPTAANGLFGRRSTLTRWFPNNPWSRRYMRGRHQSGEEPFEVEMLSTACMAVPADLAKDLGGMYPGFRHYWVDADLCGQIRKRGFAVYCVPAAKIFHFEGQGGSTSTWRQRCRATLNFHRDAYLAYYRQYELPRFHPRRLFAAAALLTRACCLMVVQVLLPHKATTSGGKN